MENNITDSVRKCERCGGELIEGELVAGYGFAFYVKGEKRKLMPKFSPVICWCCKSCGHIQDLTATELHRLVRVIR